MAKATNDRYTQFFTPDEFKRSSTKRSIPSAIGGIGVMIEPDATSGFVRVTYVLPATPAERAGLQVGDVITAVDGASTKGLGVDGSAAGCAASRARVAVAVTRSAARPRVFSITREDVQPPTVVFKMLPDGIGYVWVMEFGRATPTEFDTAIARLNEQGAKALVLDLRNDGGGYVNSALDISSRFIANKAIRHRRRARQARDDDRCRRRSVDHAAGHRAGQPIHRVGLGDYRRRAARRRHRYARRRAYVRQRRDADADAASRRRRDQDHDGALSDAEPSRYQSARHRSGRSRSTRTATRASATSTSDAQLRAAIAAAAEEDRRGTRGPRIRRRSIRHDGVRCARS